jgi:hypothetical protein
MDVDERERKREWDTRKKGRGWDTCVRWRIKRKEEGMKKKEGKKENRKKGKKINYLNF